MNSAYCTIGGTGPAIDAMAGAFDRTRLEFDLLGFAGVSGGAILATCGALGISSETIAKELTSMLDGKLVRFSIEGLQRGGLLNWELIKQAIERIIGKKTTFGDSPLPLVICVTDLDTGSPRYLSKLQTPRVKLAEALQASTAFMAFATPAIQIPSIGSQLSPDIRLFCDGGWTDNTVDHVFDGKDLTRISLRLKPDYEINRIQVGDPISIHKAVMRAALYAQSLRKSKRLDGINVDIPVRNNWDFSKNASQVESNWNQGFNSADRIYKTIRGAK
jgi:predicted acylesterase/phospholipase RssA